MDLREIGWRGMERIDLAQDRDQWRTLVNTVMNLRVPLNAGNFLNSCTTGSFSSMALIYEVSYITGTTHGSSVGRTRHLLAR
jgi:hypothetical protein